MTHTHMTHTLRNLHADKCAPANTHHRHIHTVTYTPKLHSILNEHLDLHMHPAPPPPHTHTRTQKLTGTFDQAIAALIGKKVIVGLVRTQP